MVLSLAACDGSSTSLESQGGDLLTDSTVQGEAMLESESEVLSQTEEGLRITLNGENEAVLILKSKSIGILDSVKEGDSGRILNEICITFESKDGSYYIQADIVDTSFTIYKINNDTDESEWYFSSDEYTDELREERTEDSCTIKIRQPGIAKDFSECTSFRAEFIPYEESGVVEILAEGNVSDVLSEGEKQQRLQVFLPDEDTVKFKIYGEEAKTSFYNYENMRIDIYETEEQMNADNPCPSLEITVGAAHEDSGEGGAYAIVPSQDGSRTAYDLGEDSAYSEGQTLGTDYGVVMKYNNENIMEYVKPEYLYELYFGNNKVEVGKINDIIIENEYTSIPAIPEEFVSGDEYDSWFVPVTDNYRIIGVNQTFSYGTPGWYDTGLWKYDNIGSVVNEYVKTVYLLSLDEFEIIDAKIKVIYESATGLKADLLRHTGFLGAENLSSSGRDEPDDSLVTIEALDPLDKEEFTNMFYDTTTTDYLGHTEKVRYFWYNYIYEHEHIYRSLAGFDPWGVAEAYYTDLQYNNKQIIEGTYQSYQFDAAIPYISYSYEQNPDIITDYEEERAKYNTAPDNWQEHPYTSYLPQIPSGITVDYAEGNTINETNLALCTEDNGCTKEQAESYLEAFSNIEYENEIVELRTEVTDDYEHMLIRHLKGNIRILIFWRVEEQKLFIYVDKQ